jgi:hypothetical protein
MEKNLRELRESRDMTIPTGIGRPEDTASAPRQTAIAERRRAVRKSVLWSGRLESNARLLDCAILDVSLEGIRIKLDEAVPSRGPFALACSRFGTFHAEVVWERERTLGLRFLEPPGRVADTIGRHLPLAMVA